MRVVCPPPEALIKLVIWNLWGFWFLWHVFSKCLLWGSGYFVGVIAAIFTLYREGLGNVGQPMSCPNSPPHPPPHSRVC